MTLKCILIVYMCVVLGNYGSHVSDGNGFSNRCLFFSVHKAHSCMHMVLMSEFMNPRMVWCFDGETFMGVMRLLGEACNKSCANQGIPSTNLLMRRYVLGLHLLMNHPDLLLWRNAR